MPASIAERWLPAAAAAGAVVALAFADGGYFPTAWGWAALVPLLAAAAALALRDRVAVERLDALWLGALAALAAWIGLSALWAPAVETPLLELERTLVSVAVVLALLLLCDRRAVPALLGGTLGGITAVAVYSLGTRLVPDRLGAFDSAAGYQLAEPIGYWNALGLLATLGVLLALGCAAAASSPALRAAAAAPLPVLACMLFFTFGRGAWLALAAGLCAAAALHPERVRLAGLGLALAPAPALAVWLCSRPDALNAPGAALDAAAHEGHRLAPVIVALTAVEAGIALAAPRLRVGRRVRIAVAAVLAVVVLAGLVAALARVGSPVAAFRTPVPATDADLGRRLFSASGNGRSDYWRIALEQAADEPLLGGGAGSYERRWLRDRPTAFSARDAHSVYLETLAELGPLGLGLLLAALGIPLVALARARRDPLAVTAGSAYAAFLVHAALDWDWEVPAVTVPALGLAGAVVLTARRGTSRPLGRALRIAGLVAIAAAIGFVFVLHAGSTALASSAAALERGDVEQAAADARAARGRLPWAAEPWQRLAEAQVAAGRAQAARASYREALERAPESWELWLGLATASNGAARARALARALELNPRSPEAAIVRNGGR